MSGPPDDYRESGEALDFNGCDTFAKRVALSRRFFSRVMWDPRLNPFEPGLISAEVPVWIAPGIPAIEVTHVSPVVPDTVVVPTPTEEALKMNHFHPERFRAQLVFGLYGLEAFNVRVLVQGIANGDGAIFLRIIRPNAIIVNMEVKTWADVNRFVDRLVDEARLFVDEIGNRLEPALVDARRIVRRVLDADWSSDLPAVLVPEYPNGFHLVSDVFCLGPPRFHVLSHNKTETMRGNLVAVVFSCPWLTPMAITEVRPATLERFIRDVQNRLRAGPVAPFVRAIREAAFRALQARFFTWAKTFVRETRWTRRTRMRV